MADQIHKVNFESNIRPDQKHFTRVLQKVCHWVQITSVLRFIKHIFITNLQSIPPLLKHIFVTFLPSREKQINSLLLVSVGDNDNKSCRRTASSPAGYILYCNIFIIKPYNIGHNDLDVFVCKSFCHIDVIIQV